MSDDILTSELLQKAVYDRRFTALARLGADLSEIATWDRQLDRRSRLLVPIDVQAFVVPRSGGEATVPLTGGSSDPPPFAAGSVRPLGVHLHWALPDALLRAKRVSEGSTQPEFPALPDRWVVTRAVLPNGKTQALIRGWVIDAPSGSVTPLASFDGTPVAAPPDTPRIEPLDAARGGSLLWTASYTASAGRFAFHDPLKDLPGTDLAPSGLAGDQAVYTVAGYWSTLDRDPLAASYGHGALDARARELGWLVVHDADDSVQQLEDPRSAKVLNKIGLASPDPLPAVSVLGADGNTFNAMQQLQIGAGVPVVAAEQVLLAPALPSFACLLHGAVMGVPIGGELPEADDRPAAAALEVALGADIDDVIAALGARALGPAPHQRLAAERLAAAFTSDLLDRLGSADGIADLEEREHGDQFSSLPGARLPAARPDRLRAEDAAPMNPHTLGRKGRAARQLERKKVESSRLAWKSGINLDERAKSDGKGKPRGRSLAEAAPREPRPEAREVVRPAPRWFRPQPLLIALRGAHPNHRHHGDGLFDASGLLRCRYPRECVTMWPGMITGVRVLPSLGSGAVPPEVLLVVREAVLLNPYGHAWLAAAGSDKLDSARLQATQQRLAGEMVRLYGDDGRYDGTTRWVAASLSRAPKNGWEGVSAAADIDGMKITSALAERSVLPGTPPSPVAITTWRQPWVPLWLEWTVELEGSESLDAWTLAALDLEPLESGSPGARRFRFSGRSPVGHGVSTALSLGIERWLQAERQRDLSGGSQLSDADAGALARLGDFLRPLDLVSASLDGVREQLLGMPYVGCVSYGPPGPDGRARPLANELPMPLFGGHLRVQALRLVDAFGRVLEVPAERVATTTLLELKDVPNGVRLRPRLQHQARWLFRLIDPAQPAGASPESAREAFVDQLDPESAVNPVCGFLLPDQIDEALEFFSVAGEPLGQLGHDAISGAVFWEPAPGRPLPPDAGPLADLDAHTRLTGELAAALVRADVAARASGAPNGSALSALLRAIDTTLWSVDTYASIGSSSVAGLVGRPIAVVRASLRLEIPDDIDAVSIAHAGGAEARRAPFAALSEQRFPFQLGTLLRSDDSLLGFFVDDDYEHMHIVDKVVASSARESGRHRGHLGLLGATDTPPVDPLVHPYIVPEDTLYIRPGQTLRLTLLMLPAGKVHLTSGILPRKALALGDEWVGPGLARLTPSVRVGPVLVDPSEIRLPLVKPLGDKQTFTRRTGPLTWRDDPILASTQTAYLPRLPHEAQEGWIRVTPEEPEDAS